MYYHAYENLIMPLVFLSKAPPKKKALVFVLYVATIYTAIALFQIQIDKTRNNYSKMEDMKYLPSGQFLKGSALTYDELLADFLWIKALVYFGEHYQTDKSYRWLYHLLDVIVTLDPYFEYPYEFGGIALAYWTKNVDYSIKLLKKGIMNVPKTHERYWTLPFFLGFNYMFYKKDFVTAVSYMEEATKYPGHPGYLPFLVARLHANNKDPEIAIKFLNEIYISTENKSVRKDIKKRIKEVMVERDIQILEQVRDRYKSRVGSYPLKLDDLVAEGFLKNIPQEPFGGKYLIKEDHSIQSSVIKKRMKVYID